MDYDFPTVISTPLKIDLEDPYATRFTTLPNQEDRITARNATNLRTEGPPPSTRVNQGPPDALEIARVIALHHGHLPNSQKFEELIYGPAEVKKLSQERHSKYGKLQETVFAEQWGKGSWFQAFCRGVVATENVRTLLTRYNLCAKAFEIPPAGHIETPEESQARADHALIYRKTIALLEDIYRETYQTGLDNQIKIITTAGGDDTVKKLRAAERRDHYAAVLRNLPQAEHLGRVFTSRAEIVQALPQPLANRPYQIRIDFWLEKWNRDTLASQFSKSRSIVDLKRVIDEEGPDYTTMLGQRFAAGADAFHTLSIEYTAMIERLKINMTDVDVRASIANVTWDRILEAYACIRQLNEDLGFTTPEYGTWLDVPVLVTKRSKRATGRGNVKRLRI